MDTGANALALAGQLSGAAGNTLVKTGDGDLLLAASSPGFAGATRVLAGRALLAGGSLGGSVSVERGATFGGAGAASSVTTATGAFLQVGAPGAATSPGSLTINTTLALAANSTVNFSIISGAADPGASVNSKLFAPVAGVSITGGAASALTLDFDRLFNGTYNLGNVTLLGGARVTWAGQNLSGRQSVTYDTTTAPGNLLIKVLLPDSEKILWTGGASGAWSINAPNWAVQSSNAPITFADGDTVIFGGAGSSSVAIAGTRMTVSDLFVQGSGSVGISGASIFGDAASVIGSTITGASGRLVKTGAGVLSFTNARALVYSGTFDAASAGTLAVAGSGTLELAASNASYAGSLAVNGASVLLRDAVALSGAVNVGAGGVFGGAGVATGVVSAGQGGAIRVGLAGDGSETFTAADLRLANGSLLTGSGTLAGAAQIGAAAADVVTAGVSDGATLFISATTRGAGTLAKTGPGSLAFSGAASLGHALTRIDEGVVCLRDISTAEAATVTHGFMLNGGWLDLSDAPADTDLVPLNIWGGLSFSGSLGGVIGHDDQITLGTGQSGFQIGGAGENGRGVFVVVKAGSGTATLTGDNTYAGYTRVDSGVLAVGADAALGDTTLARDLVLNGGALRVTGSFDTTRKIEARQNATVSVDAGVVTSWLDVTGTGNFTKTGEGVLALTTGVATAHSGTTFVKAGVLQGTPQALAGETINSATVAIFMNDSQSGAFTSTVRGGVFSKTGGGSLDVSGALLNADTIAVDEGILTSGNPGRPMQLAAASVVIGQKGALYAPAGGSIATQLLRNQGSLRVGYGAVRNRDALGSELLVSGNYDGGDGGMLYLGIGFANGSVVADKFTVAGAASGTTLVSFAQADSTINLPNFAGDLPANVVHVAGGGGNFTQTGRVTFGAKDYTLIYDPATGESRWRISLASEIPPVLAVDAAIMTTNRAALESLGHRLESMRIGDGGIGRKGCDTWVSGVFDRSKFNNTVYTGAATKTYGAQAGVDYSDIENAFAIGGFADRIQSDINMPGSAKTSAIVNGFGAYATYRPDKWYFDALLRATNGDYRVTIPDTPEMKMRMKGFGASLEIGRTFVTDGWMVSPHIQFSWSRTNVDRAIDAHRRVYDIDPVQSFSGRVGVLISRTFVPRKNWLLRHYVRLAYTNEFDGGTTMLLKTAGEKIPYANNLGGGGVNATTGLMLRIKDRFDIWSGITGYSTYDSGNADGFNLNFGAGYRF